jgi:hypothetical protein
MIFFSACGDTNFFGFSHKEGSNKSVAALNSDADKAYRSKDWVKADKYYQEVLDKDPKNSSAMYGKAQVAYAKAGIQLSKLISSFVTDSNTNSSQNSSNLMMLDTDILPSKTTSSSDSLIQIDLDKMENLYLATKTVVTYLRQIADNEGDGVIKANDPDVNINLAIALVLKATLSIMDNDGVNHQGNNKPGESTDAISINKDYVITMPTSVQLTELKNSLEFKNKVKQSIVDMVGIVKAKTKFSSDFSGFNYNGNTGKGAIDYLDVALQSGKLPGTSTLSDLRKNFDDFFDKSGNDDLYKLWKDIK